MTSIVLFGLYIIYQSLSYNMHAPSVTTLTPVFINFRPQRYYDNSECEAQNKYFIVINKATCSNIREYTNVNIMNGNRQYITTLTSVKWISNMLTSWENQQDMSGSRNHRGSFFPECAPRCLFLAILGLQMKYRDCTTSGYFSCVISAMTLEKFGHLGSNFIWR